ncbi:hypothetical protein [Paenibacillus sp. YPG26]|uniref:hypothetical protein n=1 Tax=Paenibacillus sp. YPG26 TaxID=2878915 RepID=UPI00203AD611|nr:hypothetical protein [Paenibacillus sp. YPG26]USB33902.1 hypothetical protein LDO05_03515 [Paenibacillus sp. YPG26]
MWEDIEVINISTDYWNKVLLDMPRTKKRILNQALNMINLIDTTEQVELAETYATAAIHFIGSIKDMLEQDIL